MTAIKATAALFARLLTTKGTEMKENQTQSPTGALDALLEKLMFDFELAYDVASILRREVRREAYINDRKRISLLHLMLENIKSDLEIIENESTRIYEENNDE